MALRYLHEALISTWSEVVYVDVEILNKISSWIYSMQAPNGSFAEPQWFISDRRFDVSNHAIL